MVCYVGLVYPRPRFGLLSHGEAVRDEPVSQEILSPGNSVARDSEIRSRDFISATVFPRKFCRTLRQNFLCKSQEILSLGNSVAPRDRIRTSQLATITCLRQPHALCTQEILSLGNLVAPHILYVLAQATIKCLHEAA